MCLINFGPDAGKLCTVLDFVDHNRVLVDGPLKLTGVGRQSIPIRWIVLTKLHVKIPFACNQKCLLKALEAGKIMEQWKKTSWAKRLETRQKRAQMTDFERFKLKMAKRVLNTAVYMKFATIRKADRKQRLAKKEQRKAQKK